MSSRVRKKRTCSSTVTLVEQTIEPEGPQFRARPSQPSSRHNRGRVAKSVHGAQPAASTLSLSVRAHAAQNRTTHLVFVVKRQLANVLLELNAWRAFIHAGCDLLTFVTK
jgi:hypothetical protein